MCARPAVLGRASNRDGHEEGFGEDGRESLPSLRIAEAPGQGTMRGPAVARHWAHGSADRHIHVISPPLRRGEREVIAHQPRTVYPVHRPLLSPLPSPAPHCSRPPPSIAKLRSRPISRHPDIPQPAGVVPVLLAAGGVVEAGPHRPNGWGFRFIHSSPTCLRRSCHPARSGRSGPPQNSLWLPVHDMSHGLSVVFVAVCGRLEAQKHWLAYSTPA
jgi:hypothetical protein